MRAVTERRIDISCASWHLSAVPCRGRDEQRWRTMRQVDLITCGTPFSALKPLEIVEEPLNIHPRSVGGD
jgi:hypothetical protein